MTDIEKLRAVIAKATPGPWDVYPAPIASAQDAKEELCWQINHTSPVGTALYLLNAGGKCPATTGCGPTSEANAAYIATFDPPTTTALLDTIDTLRQQVAEARAKAGGLLGHLQEAIERIEKGDLNERMCCDGHMCGCRGSSKADEFLHFAREAVVSTLTSEASHD